MIAKDIMKTNVVVIREDSTISDAARILVEEKVSGAPVVNKGGELVGLISERDMLLNNPLVTSVTDIMTKEVVAIKEDTAIEEISKLMLEYSIKRVPVTRDGNVVGIISRTDILRSKIESG